MPFGGHSIIKKIYIKNFILRLSITYLTIILSWWQCPAFATTNNSAMKKNPHTEKTSIELASLAPKIKVQFHF